MTHPFLFLAGAPKCGTSALYHQLVQHPRIRGSEPKETFYTVPVGHPLTPNRGNIEQLGWQGLRDYFPASEAGSWHLEATTHTIYHPEVFKNLEIPESTRFLFVLRDPVERLRSSFEYTLNNLAKFKKTIAFDAYVNLLLNGDEEQLSEYLFESPSLYVLQRDLKYGQYIDYLEQWKQFLPEHAWRVLIYEEFRQDPVVAGNEVFSWLDLESMDTGSEVRNKTQGIRSRQLHRFILGMNRMVPAGAWKQRVKQLYYRMQSSDSSRVQVDEKVRELLQHHYAPYQSKLEALLGRTIEPWA